MASIDGLCPFTKREQQTSQPGHAHKKALLREKDPKWEREKRETENPPERSPEKTQLKSASASCTCCQVKSKERLRPAKSGAKKSQ